MAPPQRQRYNAKARQSTAGGPSHKRRQQQRSAPTTSFHSEQDAAAPASLSGSYAGPDSNREVIAPDSAEEKAWKAKEEMRKELLAQSTTEDPAQKMSAKKRKRLDAYIASRLKKETRRDLLEELAKSSAEVNGDRIDFASAKTLGTGRLATGREMIEGTARRTGKKSQFHPEPEASDSDDDSQSSFTLKEDSSRVTVPDRHNGEVPDDAQRQQRILQAAALFSGDPTAASDQSRPDAEIRIPAISAGSRNASLGSALAKGMDGKPMIPLTRKRKSKTPSQRERRRIRQREIASKNGQSSISDDGDDDADDSGISDSSQSSDESAPFEALDHRIHDHPPALGAVRPIHILSKAERDAIENPDEYESGIEDDDETDSEDEAVFMEAMRRRGMSLPSEGNTDSDEKDSETSEISAQFGGADVDLQDSGLAASPPWTGFESEDEPIDNSSLAGNTTIETDAGNSHDASGATISNAAPDTILSQLERTRTSGFKEWARAALDQAASPDGEAVQRSHEGAPLQPVAGHSIKVSEMGPQDGFVRGPLGETTATADKLSPFAAKYYAETQSSKAIRNVSVMRSAGIIEARSKLPVVQEEDHIVQTILENPVSVICGETGSGKTTQVAQMLYERAFGTPGSDNPGLIGITQPRRVAAMSTADRVAKELNLSSDKVSYQIRYDGTVSPQTCLKFMTDGVLLRELANDLLLSKYSVVIIDEAHERSVNTDVLIGVLSRVVRLRAARWIQGEHGSRPLRLIIMSATLRVADFVENASLFPVPPPLVQIEARQHPVSIHFNRKTPSDYQAEAVSKAVKIHTRLPPGGILIFLTGEQEIRTVCRELEAKFGRQAVDAQTRRRNRQEETYRREVRQEDRNDGQDDDRIRITARPAREDVEAEDIALGDELDPIDQIKLEDGVQGVTDVDALDTASEAEAEDDKALESAVPISRDLTTLPLTRMYILPLYSLLPADKQLQVFKPPPEDSRLVVVATNVAETSLTIPNISYVIDCGRAKGRKYDPRSGISSFKVDWISKASAAQRAGRAGRTGPGHCYRLYSSNVYEEYLEEHTEAEIRRMPVEGLVLQMKGMNIDNVVNFPFPTPPERYSIAAAERILTRLGALETTTDEKTRRQVARITDLGRTMSLFPLSPRFAKMLVQGQQHDCLPYVIALVAAMSVGDLFIRDESRADEEDSDIDPEGHHDPTPGTSHLHSEVERRRQERKDKRKRRYEALAKFDALGGMGISDAFRTLAVVGALAYADRSAEFCKENFLRTKAMEEVRKLQSQLSSLVLSTMDPSPRTSQLAAALSSNKLAPPTEMQFKVIRQLIACAYIDQVAVRADLVPSAARSIPSLAEKASQGNLKRRWNNCQYVPYLAMGVNGEVAMIHRSSSLFEHAPPEWCVFNEVLRSQPKSTREAETGEEPQEVFDESETPGRVYLKGVTKINPAWIPKLGRDMCTFSKPISLTGSDQLKSLTDKIAALQKAGNRFGSGSSASSSSSHKAQQVVVTPTYGTGPACEPSERASMIGWELPPVKATRRWVGGTIGWKVEL